VEGEKKPLSDNVTIENVLGDKNILCLSDLSHEIFTIGSNFEAALQILCPFNLSAPVGNFEKTILQAHDKVEGKGGFLVDGMDEFLQKIL